MSRARVIVARLQGLFTHKSSEQNLDDELRFHIEMRTEENMRRGMSSDEARSAALREFGGVESTKEKYREARRAFWIESFLKDSGYALRTLTKDWGFSAVSVLFLMLGIGGNIAVFSLMDTLLFKSLPVRDPEELRFLLKTGGRAPVPYFSFPFYQQLGNDSALSKSMLAFFDAAGTLEVSADIPRPGGSPEMAHAQLVSGNYFSVLGVRPIIGRAFSIEEDSAPDSHPVAVISYSYWRSRFAGDPAALGAKILLNGSPFTVIGVASPRFLGLTPGSPPDITVPLTMQPRIWLDPGMSIVKDASFGWLRLMIRLETGAAERGVEARLSALTRQIDSNLIAGPATLDDKTRMKLTPGTRGLDALRVRFSRPLYVLMALVAFVLLIVCANIAALLLARGATRQREIATRLALGATRSRLITQLLTETLIIAASGALLGLVFAYGASALLLKALTYSAVPIKLTFTLDERLLLFTMALTVVTSLLSGMVPAFQATKPAMARSLSRGGTIFSRNNVTHSGLALGKMLIVLQLCLSLVLLIAGGLFIASLKNLQGLNAGFDPEDLLFITVNPSLVGYREPRLSTAYGELLKQIREVPGVMSATLSSHGLVAPDVDDSGFSVPGRAPRAGEPRGADLDMVGPEFFTTTRMPILLGRGITDEDGEHTPRVCVITESLARQYYSGQSPIGKRASLSGTPVEIAGVTKDVKYNSLHDEASRVVFLPYRQVPAWHPAIAQITFVVRTRQQNSDAVAAASRRQISNFDRSLPIVSIKTAKMQIAESLVEERLLAWLSGGFGTLGLLLACMGVIGTMAHTIARRTSEIGIRMAVGAQRLQLIWTFLREAIALSVAGSLLGLTLAYALSRLATSLLFAVRPTDLKTMVAAAILLDISVIGAALFPSWRASRVDPVSALRCQ